MLAPTANPNKVADVKSTKVLEAKSINPTETTNPKQEATATNLTGIRSTIIPAPNAISAAPAASAAKAYETICALNPVSIQ